MYVRFDGDDFLTNMLSIAFEIKSNIIVKISPKFKAQNNENISLCLSKADTKKPMQKELLNSFLFHLLLEMCKKKWRQ